MNISRKLKLSFALAIVLPLLIIASLVITQTRNQALDNFEMLSDREASQVDNAMQMFFSEIEKNVDFLASHPDVVSAQKDVKTYVSSNSATQLMHTQGTSTEANAYQLFNHFGETHSGLAYIYMGNEQGGYIQWPEGK